jgi:hypothetical protein
VRDWVRSQNRPTHGTTRTQHLGWSQAGNLWWLQHLSEGCAVRRIFGCLIPLRQACLQLIQIVLLPDDLALQLMPLHLPRAQAQDGVRHTTIRRMATQGQWPAQHMRIPAWSARCHRPCYGVAMRRRFTASRASWALDLGLLLEVEF